MSVHSTRKGVNQMISKQQIGDHSIEIRVDAHVVTVSSIDPNVIAYLTRIAKNNGAHEMVDEARRNGLTVTEQYAN